MNRKFGVEIEFVSQESRGAIAEALCQAGVNAVAEHYNHTTRNYWKVITDASCGFELVSPPLEGERGIAQVLKACEVLDRMATVSKNCGVHVHIDADGLNITQIKSVITQYGENEAVFDLIMPNSRRANNNSFCLSVAGIDYTALRNSHTIDDIVTNVFSSSRYYKLNIASYLRHGTIEFRQHGGSVDGEKITNWVRLIQSFVERSIDHAITTNPASLRERFEALIPATVATAAPSKLADIKKEVYRGLGLATTKAVKAWAAANGIAADLRTKAGWMAVLNAATAANSVDLRAYFEGRTVTLRTSQLLEA